jgi:ATP-dependent Clp protease ATP-binding subunit ClpB
MRQDKLTTKLQEALADAQSLAVGNDNPYIEPAHLLTALLNQDDGGARSLLQRAGVNIGGLVNALKSSLERLPKVSGTSGDVQVSRELIGMLNLADKEAQKRGDQFVSSEMILLALADDKSDAGKQARDNGLTRKALEAAIATVRGGGKVDSQEAEGQRESLKKYTLDLTERARQNPASARPPSSKGWRSASSTTKCLIRCAASACCRSTWRPCWPAPSTAANSRSA